MTDEYLRLRRGDVVLVVDRTEMAFPNCLMEGGLRAKALTVTSVTPDQFRGRYVEGGAKLYDREDVIAVRPSIEEARALFDRLCTIGREARAELKASTERISVNALGQIEAILYGGGEQ